MIKRLLSFLDASPVNFLAVKNISEELEKNGFRRMNPQEPLGKIEAGEKFFVTKNDSSIYAFQIGKKYGNKGLDNRYYKTRPTYMKGVKCKAY